MATLGAKACSGSADTTSDFQHSVLCISHDHCPSVAHEGWAFCAFSAEGSVIVKLLLSTACCTPACTSIGREICSA
jgi:hypothetical protein